ncbi:MAG: photosystem II reaction center protein PsbN [Oscillatoriales cyanobacterium]|nr:MAG: photosystem II reaction center protein PsbN [Oscillatoriales cyanobacterium]
MFEDNSALTLGISLGTILIAITGYSIYVAFGPPSVDLADPFEDHED